MKLWIWNQIKLWSLQLWTQFGQVVWTRDRAILVRRSNQLSYEATDVGSWSFVGIARSPVQTSLKSWIFQASLRNCQNCVHNCKDHSFTCYSLNSHCFEEYRHCHNCTRTPFPLLILATNLSKTYHANNQKQFMIVFPYRCFPAFAFLLITNKTLW